MGQTPLVDLHPFRFTRFREGDVKRLPVDLVMTSAITNPCLLEDIARNRTAVYRP